MADLKWTRNQIPAVKSRGSDVLVTASAGTGKTAVLSGRCVEILSEPSAPNASELLVLTFTEAAADEMRSRIASELRRKFQQTANMRLRRQLIALESAQISTIHAFCRKIIAEFFYRLDIDPYAGIMDEDEKLLISRQVLDETINQAWREPATAQAMEKLFRGRNTEGTGGFLKYVIGVSDFLESLPDHQNWYERAEVLSEYTAWAGYSLYEKQREIILAKLETVTKQIEFGIFLDQKLGGIWGEQLETEFLSAVRQCIELIKNNDTHTCSVLLRAFSFKFKNKPKGFDTQTAEIIKDPVRQARNTLKKLKSLCVLNEEYQRLVAPYASLQTKTFIELVKRYQRNYAREKKRLNRLDFSDLEHFALRLLEGHGDVTDILKNRYKYIFVDEYQDINALQQRILQKIQRGGNCFVVGDIKQCIYAFRQARPDIFVSQIKKAVRPGTAGVNSLAVDLIENFRSRKEILDFANRVFSRLMSGDFASIKYDENATLLPAFEYEPAEKHNPSGEPLVELNIIEKVKSAMPEDDDETGKGEEEASGDVQCEAMYIAERIKRMVGVEAKKPEFNIYDKQTGAYRPVQYRDIVVLMRSLSASANTYVEIFSQAGVPVNSSCAAGYFQTTEITDCVAFLELLDNPRQDIPLAAVMRSPFFGFSDTELAEITSQKFDDGDIDFYGRAKHCAENGPDSELRDKLSRFFGKLCEYRELADSVSVAELIWHIFRETGYLTFVRALPNGPQRRANLLKLHERAIQFEGFASAGGTGSLCRFAAFIRRLLENKSDWAPAEPDSSAQNAVRIMSVHKSKGLEFPVVFLAGLSRNFNLSDTRDDVLTDENIGLGLRIINNGVKLSGVNHQIIAEKIRKDSLAEEIRILYVAATRARERLIMTASAESKKCGKTVTAAAASGGGELADWQILSANSALDWLLKSLGDDSAFDSLFESDTTESKGRSDLITVRLIDPLPLSRRVNELIEQKRRAVSGPSKIVEPHSDLLRTLKDKLQWRYPCLELTEKRAKTSVSAITHPQDEFAVRDYSQAFDLLPEAAAPSESLDPRLRGTAVHLVMENLPLDPPVTAEKITQTVELLLSENRLTKEMADSVSPENILAFFETDAGKTVLKNPAGVWREWPFTVTDGSEGEDSVIIQGIIDLLIDSGDSLKIVDFKNDRLSPDATEQRARHYAEQVRLYARAAQTILKKPVSEAHIYFFNPRKQIRVI